MLLDEALARKLSSLWPHLNERQRRLLAAAEARELGRGGIAAVCRAAGISRPTVELGLKELDEPAVAPPARSRYRRSAHLGGLVHLGGDWPSFGRVALRYTLRKGLRQATDGPRLGREPGLYTPRDA